MTLFSKSDREAMVYAFLACLYDTSSSMDDAIATVEAKWEKEGRTRYGIGRVSIRDDWAAVSADRSMPLREVDFPVTIIKETTDETT